MAARVEGSHGFRTGTRQTLQQTYGTREVRFCDPFCTRAIPHAFDHSRIPVSMTAARSDAVTRALAEFLADTTYEDLPSTVIDDAKRAALDWLGSALAGALEPPAR